MAKIILTSLVSAIKGKLRGDCFQTWKSINTLRSNPNSKTHTPLRSIEYRNTISYLSGLHYSLSDSQKTAWNTYALLISSNYSGFNSFIARNSSLLMATHSCLSLQLSAPTFYDPPFIPSPLSLCYYPFSNTYCFNWSSPNCVNVFVQLYYAPQSGFSNQIHPKLKFYKTVPSTDLCLIFNAASFPSDTVIRFSARSINIRGECSLFPVSIPPPDIPACLAVLSPNGLEWYIYNQIVNISWRSKYIYAVNIYYSLNNGASYTLIASDVLASLCSYSWTIPSFSSYDCLIKICDASNESNFDVSDSSFCINENPLITLTSPVGGESFPAENYEYIHWDYAFVTLLSIYYSIDSGLNWTLIDDSQYSDFSPYEWLVPDTPSSHCRVKIVSTGGYIASSESPADFTITG